MSKKYNINDAVNVSVENAFLEDKFEFDFYEYLKSKSVKRSDVIEFINSSLFLSLFHQIEELDLYIDRNLLTDSYEWLGKEKSLKIKTFLQKIISDAKQYEIDRKPGRKRKVSS